MSEFSISEAFYSRSVRCTYFLNEVKSLFELNTNISDTHFIPVIKGYEIEYINSGVSEKLCINIKNRFYNGLIIKKYVDGKIKRIYFAKENFSEAVNRIFKK